MLLCVGVVAHTNAAPGYGTNSPLSFDTPGWTNNQVPPPVLHFAAPTRLQLGARQIISLRGTGFQPGAEVALTRPNPALRLGGSCVLSATNIALTLAVAADAVPGEQGFTVTNPDGQSASVSNLFAVVGPFAIVSQTINAARDRLTLVWNSRPGAVYSLERGPAPSAVFWTNIAPAVVASGWRTTADFACSPSKRQEFFRLRDDNASVVGLHPTNVADEVAFWSFQEDSGERVDEGPQHFRLQEGTNGPVLRAQPPEGAPFGPYAAAFGGTRYLWIPRRDLGPLNLSGSNTQVTVIAWLKRQSASINAIAGIWDETRSRRQYCLFVDVNRSTQITNTVQERVSGHVSQYGGSSPGRIFCYEVSLGDSLVASNQWTCVAMTYDGEFIRSFYQGRFDGAEPNPPPPYNMGNPYYAPLGIFDGGVDGADFTVSAVSVSGKMGNWFKGELGGLAVYRRALTAEELLRLAKPTLP